MDKRFLFGCKCDFLRLLKPYRLPEIVFRQPMCMATEYFALYHNNNLVCIEEQIVKDSKKRWKLLLRILVLS